MPVPRGASGAQLLSRVTGRDGSHSAPRGAGCRSLEPQSLTQGESQPGPRGIDSISGEREDARDNTDVSIASDEIWRELCTYVDGAVPIGNRMSTLEQKHARARGRELGD